MFTKDMADINALKKAAKPYAGDGKTGVHNIVLANWNVVDLEIAFVTSSSDEADKSASFIDFAALQKTGRGFEIVFFEAKHFSNGALRASGDAVPKVIGQIERYKNLLEEQLRRDIRQLPSGLWQPIRNLQRTCRTAPRATRDTQGYR